ncbi:MAG: hypothetical protein VKO39_09165 [Cyanobacteriota bacterium]|nr:hypothetical protein [Cyanobacteriota bacterium]
MLVGVFDVIAFLFKQTGILFLVSLVVARIVANVAAKNLSLVRDLGISVFAFSIIGSIALSVWIRSEGADGQSAWSLALSAPGAPRLRAMLVAALLLLSVLAILAASLKMLLGLNIVGDRRQMQVLKSRSDAAAGPSIPDLVVAEPGPEYSLMSSRKPCTGNLHG